MVENRLLWAMDAESHALDRLRETRETYECARVELARAQATVDAELRLTRPPGPPVRAAG